MIGYIESDDSRYREYIKDIGEVCLLKGGGQHQVHLFGVPCIVIDNSNIIHTVLFATGQIDDIHCAVLRSAP